MAEEKHSIKDEKLCILYTALSALSANCKGSNLASREVGNFHGKDVSAAGWKRLEVMVGTNKV